MWQPAAHVVQKPGPDTRIAETRNHVLKLPQLHKKGPTSMICWTPPARKCPEPVKPRAATYVPDEQGTLGVGRDSTVDLLFGETVAAPTGGQKHKGWHWLPAALAMSSLAS
jgi:hypothetical protein